MREISRMRRARSACAPAAVAAAVLAPAAAAQEAMYTAAATMPSKGTVVLREQVHYQRFGSDDSGDTRRVQRAEVMTTLSVGLDRALALSVDVPAAFEWADFKTGGSEFDKGVEDLDLTLKWRIFKHDSGGIDTTRAALMLGAHVASGDDEDFSSQSVNPHVGVVWTRVVRRHGFNLEGEFTWNTGGEESANLGGDGPHDAVRLNGSYVYRLAPARYGPESRGAWYATAELNGLYETNGDWDLRWAPGLMFEGWRWGFEVMAQFPLYQDVDERPEFQVAIGAGIRLAF